MVSNTELPTTQSTHKTIQIRTNKNTEYTVIAPLNRFECDDYTYNPDALACRKYGSEYVNQDDHAEIESTSPGSSHEVHLGGVCY